MQKLHQLRKQEEGYLCHSFPPISASGPNTVMPFYSLPEANSRSLFLDDIYLIDTGAHFIHGTTDVARVISFSSPSSEQQRIYTLLLKAIIRACTTPLSKSTTFYDLDQVCRSVLLDVDMMCPHPIGHGVGHCLDVVEGPIDPDNPDSPSLEEGMIMTFEPGCYLVDQSFGIRLENMYIVSSRKFGEDNEDQLELENITLVPFDKSLINPDQLDPIDIKWINSYHEKVLQIIGAELKENGKEAVYEWLKNETSPLNLI